MQEKSQSYRISRLKNNFTKTDEEPFLKTINSSSTKKLFNNSRIASFNKDDLSRKVTFNSSNKYFKQKLPSQKNIVQFNNVKWLSIISAYDPKKLQFVTASRDSYQKFLKETDVRGDQFGRNEYKVIIDNFKRWAQKINKGYTKILNIFLYPPAQASPIETFSKVRPMLQSIKIESEEMHDKVKHCMEIQDYRQFKGLLIKFDTFFQASKDIEKIIFIVNKSKNKIDDLFKEIEVDPRLKEKVENERKRGLKQVRKAVRDYKDDEAQAKILDKVEAAINEMADKSIYAFSKIEGARALIDRIKEVFHDKRNSDQLSLDDIVTINKIFQEVLSQAYEFEKFAEKFLKESNTIINDDLRSCIVKYLEQVEYKKKAVLQMQLGFITTILQSSIQLMIDNFQICHGLESDYYEEYKVINALLQDICCMLSDEGKRSVLQSMMKDTVNMLRVTNEIVGRLKQYEGTVYLDNEQGLQSLKYLQKQVYEYKQLFKKIIKKQKRTQGIMNQDKNKKKQLQSVIQFSDDPQLNYIVDLIKASQKLNSPKKQQLTNYGPFSQINQSQTLSALGTELNDIKIIKWAAKGYQKYTQYQSNNPIQTLIQSINLQNREFQLSPIIIRLYQIYSKREADFLIQLNNLTTTYHKHSNQSQIIRRVYERSVALVVSRGLKKGMLEMVQNPKIIQFPQTQADIKSLRTNINYLKIVNKNILGTLVQSRVGMACQGMKQIIQGTQIAQELKWNKQNKYYIENKEICDTIDKVFDNTFVDHTKTQIQSLQYNVNKCIQHLQELLNRQTKNSTHEVRTHKLTQLINRKIEINEQLLHNIEELPINDHLSYYSQIVYYFTDYLHQTCQSCYVVLNTNKQVLWLCINNNSKYSGIANKLNAQQMQKGQIVSKYNHNSYAQVRNKHQHIVNSNNNISKNKNKNKAKDDDDMEQIQMQQEQEQYRQQMQEMQDNMDEQYGQDQQMEDNIDQIQDHNDNIHDIEEVQDGDEVQEIEDQITFNKHKNKDSKQIKQSSQGNTNTNVHASKGKQKQKHKEQAEVEKIVIKERKVEYVYEQLSIQTIQELQSIIKNLQNLPTVYWKSVPLYNIQLYLNQSSHQTINIEKEYKDKLNQFCHNTFRTRIVSTLKHSKNYIHIVQSINKLNKRKKQQFVHILTIIKHPYSILTNQQHNIIWFSISQDQWQSRDCVVGYVHNINKELNIGQFNVQSYVQQLQKTVNQCQTKYYIPKEELCPSVSQIKEQLKNNEKCMGQYSWKEQSINLTNYPDQLNLPLFILKLWHNTLSPNKVNTQIPNKLITDMNTLKHITKRTTFLHHYEEYRDNIVGLYGKVCNHHKLLQKMSSQTDQKNIVQNIRALGVQYGCKEESIVRYHDDTIFISIDSMTIQKSQLNQLQELLMKILKISWKIQSKQILQIIKHHHTQYHKYSTQIHKLLRIINIQTHVWNNQQQLILQLSMDTITHKVIKQSYFDAITQFSEEGQKYIHQLLCQYQHHHNESVLQYRIPQESPLGKNTNHKYKVQYDKLMNQYNNRYKQHDQLQGKIAKSILYNMLNISQQHNGYVQSYIQSIRQILNRQILNGTTYDSIYPYHIKTNQTINNTKSKLQQEINTIQQIFTKTQVQSVGGYVNSKYEQVIRWYCNNKGNVGNIRVFRVCQCKQQCKQSYICYIGFGATNIVQELLSIVSNNHHQLNKFLKLFIHSQHNTNYQDTKIVHLQQISTHLHQLIRPNNHTLGQLLMAYNIHHFICPNAKQVHNQKDKWIRAIQDRYNTLQHMVNIQTKLTQPNQLVQYIHKQFNISSAQQQCVSIKQQIQQLNENQLASMLYEQFCLLYSKISIKKYKNQLYMLLNKYSSQSQIVCFLPKTHNITQSLTALHLPTQYWEKSNQLQLKQQEYNVKVHTNLAKDKWKQFQEDNYGLPSQHKLLLSVYSNQLTKNKQNTKIETLLSVSLLGEEQVKVPVQINSTSICKDLVFYILKVRAQEQYRKQDVQSITIQIVKKETHNRAYLNQSIMLKTLGAYIQQQYNKANSQQQKYLALLCSQLDKAHIYKLDRDHITQNSKKSDKQLIWNNNKKLMNQTQILIHNEIKGIDNIQQANKFEIIATNYIHSLYNMLVSREQLLKQVLDTAHKQYIDKVHINNNHNHNHHALVPKLMEQIQEHPNYKPQTQSYVINTISKLQHRETQILFITHQ